MAEIILNHAPWLGSEVGMVLKTKMINSTTAITKETEKDADGVSHTIAKSGSVYYDATSGVYGLIYEDVDITDGARMGSVMIAGYYVDAELPATAATYKTNFAAQGLFPVVYGDVTRPTWATVS